MDFVTAINNPFTKEIDSLKKNHECELLNKDRLIIKLILLIHILLDSCKESYKSYNHERLKNSGTNSLCNMCKLYNFCIQNHDLALNNKPLIDSEINRCFMKSLIYKVAHSIYDFKDRDKEQLEKYINTVFNSKETIYNRDYEITNVEADNWPVCFVKEDNCYSKESELKFLLDFINKFKDLKENETTDFTDYGSLKTFLETQESAELIYGVIKSLIKVASPRFHLSAFN